MTETTMRAEKVQITRCYLVQIVDKDGNELDADYTFVSREDAKKLGQQMIDKYNKERSE